MNKNLKRIGTALLKALMLFALAEIIALASRLIFVDNMFEEEYFSEQVMNIIHTVFFLFIFNSLVIAFHSHNSAFKEQYLARSGNGKLLPTVKFIFTSPEFYLEIVCITLVSIALPTSFLYGFAVKAFFKGAELTGGTGKLYTLLIILPLMFIIEFFARAIVAKSLYRENQMGHSGSKPKQKEKILPTLKSVATVAVVYCGFSLMIPWILPFFITLYNLGGWLLFLWLLLILVAVVAMVFAFVLVRAIFKQKTFVKKLKKYCAVNSVNLSKIRKPYSSIFRLKPGYDFTFEKDGVRYDCKFLAGIFVGSPMVLSDKGDGLTQLTIRPFCVELFYILSKFDFAFDSDGKKILIVLPCPKRIFASTHGEPQRLADTGEKIGKYTFYTATGFLGALDRNCL